MYTIYRIRDGELTIIKKLSANLKDVWIHAESPSADELAELQGFIHIPQEVIKDTKDLNEVPKLDAFGETPFILIQTPVVHADKAKKPIRYTVAPLGILIEKKCVFTIAWQHSGVQDYIEEKLKNIRVNRFVDTADCTQFAIKLLLFTSKVYLRYLKDIHQDLHLNPAAMRARNFDKGILDLLRIEETLVYFNASLHSNYIVAEKVDKRKLIATEPYQELVDDVLDECRQAVETVTVYGHIANDLRNALASLISNNLNRNVYWLTKLTVILMIPTLLATFYGMNVVLPLADQPHAFLLTVLLSIALTAGGILWLNRQQKR